MIRDLDSKDKIKYAKAFVDDSTISFAKGWFCDPEAMFQDIDFYVAKTFWHEFTLKAKVSGTICGILILPFIFITFVIILIIANVLGGSNGSEPPLIVRAIVLFLLIIPFGLIRFPFSLYSYLEFRKNALFYLLEAEPDDTST